MRGISDINWSNLSLPNDTTQSKIVKEYEEACKDLVKLNKEFEHHFSNKKKKSVFKFMNDKLAEQVQLNVHYINDGNTKNIDCGNLINYIAKEDRQLFADVCNFCFQYIQYKPATDRTLNKFRSLLIIFMCKVGF